MPDTVVHTLRLLRQKLTSGLHDVARRFPLHRGPLAQWSTRRRANDDAGDLMDQAAYQGMLRSQARVCQQDDTI